MESAGTVRARDDDTENGERNGPSSTAKRQRLSVGGGRGAGYSPPEISFFLSLLEEHLPVSRREWKAVCRLHNAQFPSLHRTSHSLRRKFSSLCRSSALVEESECPPDVRRALTVKRRMKNRGEILDDDGDDGSDAEDEERDDDSSHNGSVRRHDEEPQSQPPPQPQPPVSAAVRFDPRYPTPPNHSVPLLPTQHAPPPVPVMVGDNHASLRARIDAETDLIQLIKMQLLQNIEDERQRRADERERREEERRHREEERALRDEYRNRWEEERAQRREDLRRYDEEREEARRRHSEFMQMILSLVAKNKEIARSE